MVVADFLFTRGNAEAKIQAMKSLLATFLIFLAGAIGIFAQAPSQNSADAGGGKKVFVVPVQGEINSANLYIVRRGVKEALAAGADALVIDVNTPGGDLETTFTIIEMLQKFPGATAAFVNPDAISAGAYISGATQKIYFAPNGKIGAAAVVNSTGADVDKTMKQKIDSYLIALTKTFSKEDPLRANIIRAMMDSEYVLKINGEILTDENGDPVKAAGSLLTLTADEAMREIGSGDSARPLLGAGKFGDIDEMLAAAFPGFVVEKIEPNGYERIGQFAAPIVPVLLGLGVLLLFFELKSPGFGAPGIIGIALIAAYFIFQHIAGLAGCEGLLISLLGAGLIAVEIFLMPGFFVFAIAGVLLLLVGLFWGSVDVWQMPDGSLDITWSSFLMPLENLFIAIATIVVAGILAYKFLPAKWVRDRIILGSKIGVIESEKFRGARSRSDSLPPVGTEGTALTEFRPMGIVEINGAQYEASAESGSIEKGEKIVVAGMRDFELIVKKLS